MYVAHSQQSFKTILMVDVNSSNGPSSCRYDIYFLMIDDYSRLKRSCEQWNKQGNIDTHIMKFDEAMGEVSLSCCA